MGHCMTDDIMSFAHESCLHLDFAHRYQFGIPRKYKWGMPWYTEGFWTRVHLCSPRDSRSCAFMILRHLRPASIR